MSQQYALVDHIAAAEPRRTCVSASCTPRPGRSRNGTVMNRAFAFILIFAMVAGIAAGWFVNSHYPAARAAEIADNLSILTDLRSAEHTSELQSLMRISYAVFSLTSKQ